MHDSAQWAPMTSLSSAIHRLRSGLVIPPVELVFTSHPSWPCPKDRSLPTRLLEISVLDSSFNPPTAAHLGLLNARRPRYNSIDTSGRDYDAKLLLLSVRNADKQLKSTDATYTQRLEMMMKLAEEVTAQGKDEKEHSEHENVAVAIIDEPTFVGKSSLLQRFLRERTSSQTEFRLTFLLGFDTLERFFAPRYYTNGPPSDDKEALSKMYSALEGFFAPNRDGSRIVCARRSPSSYPQSIPPPNAEGSSSPDPAIPQSLASVVHDFLTSRSLPTELVKMIDIGEDVWAVSSSDVRNAILKGDSKWKTMVPSTVKSFVEAENLYSS
ncbi:hypothetical protein V5O48_002431 [Marasmius crinis-equi]|uniref:Nicotinamide-nucleotide adenylyltransferase n=1 Tax=Marasmius crinis-equi TaxID=585013 RepID=A0ABR3FVV9_9AGAR